MPTPPVGGLGILGTLYPAGTLPIIDAQGTKIPNVADPTLPQDAATKAYADSSGAGIVADLTALAIAPAASGTGTRFYVVDQDETYTLYRDNTFHAFSPLIIPSVDGGNWFKRSKAYVVGNFTLWCAPFGGPEGTGDAKYAGFTPGQLTASNAQAPDIVLNLSASINPLTESAFGLLVDNLGNLWVNTNIGLASGVIYKFNLKDCLGSGSPTAAVKIPLTFPAASECAYSCFDRQNNLWALAGGHGTFGICVIQKFGPHAYALSGSPVPDITITLPNPGGVAPSTSNAQNAIFDSQGNMWISLGFTGSTTGGGSGNGGIIMLTAAQLTTTATVTPTVSWTGSNFDGSGIIATSGLCFGPTGLLWVTDSTSTSNRIRAWNPRGATSGNPAPSIILTSASFNVPSSIVFDAAGNMWVCNDGNSLICRIPKGQLGASGVVVPDVVLSQSGVLNPGNYISFPNNPDRSGLLPSGVPITF